MDRREYWEPEDYRMSSYGYKADRFDRSAAASYEEAFYRGQEALRTSAPEMQHQHRGGYYPHSKGYPDSKAYPDSSGYSAESTDADSTYEAHLRAKRRESHSRRPPTSTQHQIALLEQEREQILADCDRLDHLQQYYVNQLTKALSDQQSYKHNSPEFQDVQRVVKRIVQDMHSKIGMPEEVTKREQIWRERLSEIEERLNSFQKSRFQPLSSPESSQVSGNGSQWCSPPLSHNSDSLTYNSDGSLLTDVSLPHHVMQLPSQSSGFCDNDSDLTSSSHTRKPLSSPYSTGVGTSSSQSSTHNFPKGLEIPAVFQNHRIPRSASVENTSEQANGIDPADVLARVHGQHHSGKLPGKYPFSLSQDTFNDFRLGYYSPSSLSQSGHLRLHQLDPYYRKPGSPASSSDTSSMVSSVVNRLGSQSASEVSFTTNSSSRSNPNRLPRPPRPPSLSSSSGSNTSILPTRYHHRHRSKSELPGFPPYQPTLPPHYDSDHEESTSTPILPSMKKAGQVDDRSLTGVVPKKQHPHMDPPGRPPIDAGMLHTQRRERDVQIRKRRKRPDQPRIPEEGSYRDSFSMKLEMVFSVLSVVSSQKDQTDADAVKILLALSQSSETCSVMRQSACMNMLIQIMHNIEHKGDKSHREARLKAQLAMKNIIESTGDTRQGKYELCVLGVLERLRSHCDALFEFIYSHPSSRRVDSSESDSLQSACDSLLNPVRKLYKYSNEKEHYRPAILSLGGLQATAELLIVNHRLIAAQKGASRSSEKLICHSSKVITVIISILINLTYGDVNNKTTLCQFSECLKSLMFHLRQQNEGIISSGAQVLRNLSWRATADIKESLLKCDASLTLMAAVDHIKDEPTIQHLTSALWNLSAHSAENRHKICSAPFGIQQLVELLSYNSPSGTTAVVENVGGILKNLSVVIMQEEEYRRKFREAGGLAKLVQHLKSKNRTVLSNATGILWNVSARSPEDQKLLWDLGCIPLLDVLQTAHYKNVAECARGALRNLLAFGQSNGWTSRSDVNGYNIKTQKGLSKSLCYAANCAFNHNQQNKNSSESLHSGRSQPLPGCRMHSSNSSLTPAKSSTERIGSAGPRRRGEGTDGRGYGSSNDEEEAYIEKSKSKLKWSRVGSAPGQASNEWSSYVPGSFVVSSKQSSGSSIAQKLSHPEDSKKRKATRNPKPHGKPYNFSLSQSESYHLSSELNPPSGAAVFGLPNPLAPEGASLSMALTNELEPFDPNQQGSAKSHEEYADLDVDEDDDVDDIDTPIHHEGPDPTDPYSCAADNFARIQTTMRRGSDPRASSSILRSLSGPVGRQSPGKGGTCNLALDGTIANKRTEAGRGVRPNREGARLARSVSQGTNLKSDV